MIPPLSVTVTYPTRDVCRVGVPGHYDSGDFDPFDALLFDLHKTNARLICDRANLRARAKAGYPPERGP
jgi:hypothetical protein